MTVETSYEGAFPSETDFDELSYRITSRNEHPVVQYVRELPFESAVYPVRNQTLICIHWLTKD